MNIIGNNAVQVDAIEAERKAREKYPKLLEQNEKILLAFKDRGGKGRDNSCFTNTRIIVKDRKGLGKKVEFRSLPYDAIKAYSVATAGKFDTDSELEVFSEGYDFLKMDFVKEFDIFSVKRLLNSKVLINGKVGAEATVEPTMEVPTNSGSTSIWDIIGDNSSQIDAKEMEQRLQQFVLLSDESVEMAFQCGRDTFCMTSKRLLWIDVEGLTGKKIRYFTVTWSCIKAFAVETAGKFDRDSELTLFTKVPSKSRSGAGRARRKNTRIDIDFRKGKVDLMAVQKYISDKVLGPDTVATSEFAVDCAGENDEGSKSFFAWAGDDNRMIDATEMNRKFHSHPHPILQACESCEMAFKGRRDLVLFTTKRLIAIDYQGWSGKKVEYLSIPWSTVQIFAVRSAGSFMDKDSEMMIWPDFDDIYYPPSADADSPPPPPIPRRSYIELDFQKDKVDLMAIHRYLSERCLRVEGKGHLDSDGFIVPDLLPYYVPVAQEIMQPSPPNCVEQFLNWLGDDAVAVDPKELNEQLHDTNPMLQHNEHIVMAFKSGRDIMMFTGKRVLRMDVQGFSGKKICWMSVPYTSLRAFSVESAGSWDRDTQVKLYCKTYWMNGVSSVIKQDLRKGRADILTIQDFLSHHLFGLQDGSTTLDYIPEPTKASTMNNFFDFIKDDGIAQDIPKLNQQFHSSTPILQTDESIEVAFKAGRDLFLLTTKRILSIDVQGWSGKKVAYESYPLRYCHAFTIESAGYLMSASELKIYTSIPGKAKLEQELSSKSADIWAVHQHLTKKLIR